MLQQKSIQMLKEKLLQRKEELLFQTSSSKELINELLSERATDDVDYAEISSDSFNMSTLRDKQLEEIKEIEIALAKIENKTYSICEMCDEDIGLQRLKVKPHARFCVECRPVYEESLKEK